jgi:hypothetical protein
MRILNPDAPDLFPTFETFDAEYGSGGIPPVAVFDFDGVLCSPREDLVYKLPEQPGERDKLEAAAHHYGLDSTIYDTPYLRHLILQSILADRGVAPEPGPLLELAAELSRAGRSFFILTARSGRAAIDRALAFLTAHEITPQEIFFVGRVAKGRQLALVRRTVPDRVTLAYFEDTYRHSRNSKQQDVEDLEPIYVDWPDPARFAAEELIAEALTWFARSTRGGRVAA